jgi:hypothetical protein
MDAPVVTNYKGDRDKDREDGGDRRLPLTLWQTVYTAAVKFGPWAVIAAFLIWFITLQISAQMGEIKNVALASQKELHDHIRDNRFYFSALCYIAAKQAGEPAERCTPPRE